jgi:translation initiation factor IF-3
MKEQQKSRAKSKQVELKQMRFGLKIGQGDLDIKLSDCLKTTLSSNSNRPWPAAT